MRPPARPRPHNPEPSETPKPTPVRPEVVAPASTGAGQKATRTKRTSSPKNDTTHSDESNQSGEWHTTRSAASTATPAPQTKAVPVPAPASAAVVWSLDRADAVGPADAESARSSVSTGFVARLDERTRAQRRRHWIRYSIIGAALLVILTILWLVFLSPVFRLSAQKVEITGEGTVIEPGAVQKVVAGEVDTPLTVMDTVGLRNSILDVPGVRDVVLTRQWPDGLLVELTAREPVAAVPDGDSFTLRDDLGDVVGRAEKVPKELPVIEIPDGADTGRSLEAAIFMLNAIPADLHQEIKSVGAKTPDAVTMKLRDGATVLWGNQKDADLKVRVFEVLRSAEETRGAKVFDVSAPNAPITR